MINQYTLKLKRMENRSEKLSLLSDLIALMRADDSENDKELNFIQAVADRLDVTSLELDELLRSEVPFSPPASEADRILQFHRMVLLMNVDDDHNSLEMNKIRELGVRLGLNPFAIERVLKLMNRFDDKIVPPDVLINIFKTQYN